MPTLTIERSRAWVDHLRSYKVLIDDRNVGHIKDGETWKTHVSPGPHTIRCTIDWARTEPFHVKVDEEDEVHLKVEIDLSNPFKPLLGRHLTLRRIWPEREPQ